jgi:F420H(2)-dependent quinone reductase
MAGGKARLPPRWFIKTAWHVHRRIVRASGGRKGLGRPAVGGERERLWQRWRELDKNLDSYAARRPQETAVVVLEPRAAAE